MYVPVPDVIHRPSEPLRQVLRSEEVPAKVSGTLRALTLDPAIRNVRFSLKDVYIIDNRDPGKGDIYLVTVVTDDVAKEPFTLTVKTFEDIPDHAPLPLGPAGLAIYRNEPGRTPRFLDYRIVVMESDHELRDAGDVLAGITGTRSTSPTGTRWWQRSGWGNLRSV